MVDIRYETFDNNLDASKDRAEKYFDSATVTTSQKLMDYFWTLLFAFFFISRATPAIDIQAIYSPSLCLILTGDRWF